VPEIAFLLIYILSAVLWLAVTIMASYHVYAVASGETSVESQDHEHYRHIAKARGEVSLPVYALTNTLSLLYLLAELCKLLRSGVRTRVWGAVFFLFLTQRCRKLKNLELFFNIGSNG
jgi:hypothetical protein